MSTSPSNRDEVVAGLVIAAFGAGVAALAATRYPLGTAARMGSGYMPALLGAVLAVLGLLVALRAGATPERRSVDFRAGARPLVLVLGAVVLFAGLVSTLGLVPTGALVVLAAAFGSPEARWREAMPLAIIAALAGAFVFVELLGLPYRLWPLP